MVILRPSPRVADEFECEVAEDQAEDKSEYVYVRPCERYKELYKSYHLNNYKHCLEYRKTKNIEKLDPVVNWEKNLIETRVNTVLQNKAWEMRETPPEFDAPLPEFIAKRQKGSLFDKVTE